MAARRTEVESFLSIICIKSVYASAARGVRRGRPPRLGDRRRARPLRDPAGADGPPERARADGRHAAARPPARRRAPDRSRAAPSSPTPSGRCRRSRTGGTVLAELARGAAGHVAICASPIVSTYALPTILKRFSETHPGVQVAVRTGHSEEMIELVKRDEVAVGLLRAFNDPDVEQFTLYEDELVLVVHAAHPCGDVVRLARSRGGAVRPLRPRVELPRADERDLPRGGHRAAQRDGARQRRLGEEDGRAGPRRRIPPARRGRGRDAQRHACGSSSSPTAGRCAARSSRCGGRTRARRSARRPRSSTLLRELAPELQAAASAAA